LSAARIPAECREVSSFVTRTPVAAMSSRSLAIDKF
jgi:hypothetical protein